MDAPDIKLGYKRKYKLLKRSLKELAYLNAALACEISGTENRIQAARMERKLLLKKLLQFENLEEKRVKSVARHGKTDHNHKQNMKKSEPSVNDDKGESFHEPESDPHLSENAVINGQKS